MKTASHPSRSGPATCSRPGGGLPARPRAFTIIEIMMAITIFSLIVLGIYEIYSAVMKGSMAGLKAAAMAQRARVSIKAIEDALVTAQMFSANGKLYAFVADEKQGSLSFVARLPATFPGVGRYGDQIVRRVTFYVDSGQNLIVTQMPMMVAEVAESKGYEPYTLQLAKDVTLLMFEFWDDQKKEYVSEWARTNQLPKLVRVALGLGKAGNNSQQPQDFVTRVIAMPSMAIPPQWQTGGGMPGMRPGMPGMQPGMPGMQPGMPGMQPGMPGMQPGMPGMQPGRGPR